MEHSQIFCVRQDTAIGLAAILIDDGGHITLLETHLAAGDILDDFSSQLKDMVTRFSASEVWVSPLGETEPAPRKLQAFKGLDSDVDIQVMPYLVSPTDGRIAWAEALKAGRLDTSSIYKQSAKLAERIRRAGDHSSIAADVHAFLCAVALAEPVEEFDPHTFGTVAEAYHDYGLCHFALTGL